MPPDGVSAGGRGLPAGPVVGVASPGPVVAEGAGLRLGMVIPGLLAGPSV